MATVQWRPEVNALTTPQSYRPRYVPRNVNGYDELAVRIVQKHPTYNEDMVKTIMAAMIEEIRLDLINGNQVTLSNAFTFRLSLNSRLDVPDDPLPPVEDILRVRVAPSRPFVEAVRQAVHLERLPVSEKLPLITVVEDSVLKLSDVLNPSGALRLTGNDLLFEPESNGSECVLEGTRDGRAVQSRFVHITDSDITLLPNIPAQADPWNNEYILTVSTRYTEHGTLRTGIYRRRLRSPLTVAGIGAQPTLSVGILTDHAAAPYVTVTNGSLTANETLRIQVILDLHEGDLLFNLLDIREDGEEGEAVRVTAAGSITLPGFAGSALSKLKLTVNSFEPLAEMIRNSYSGRLVDVLEVGV